MVSQPCKSRDPCGRHEYIPPKNLRPEPKVIEKASKPLKASTVDKAVLKALHGTSRKFTMPLWEAYADLFKDDIANDIKAAWEEEKKKFIASDEKCKSLVGRECNSFLSQQYPKLFIRAQYLLRLLEDVSEDVIERCEQHQLEKSTKAIEQEPDIKSEYLIGIIQDTY